MEGEWAFSEQLDDCIDEARKEGLSWEQIVQELSLKIKDVHMSIKLGGKFLVEHMD